MSDNANLYAIFARNFASALHAPFLVTPEGPVHTFGDAERESARLANYLSSLALPRGARISVQCEKSVAFVWLYLACLRAGLVFHPLNPGYTAAEVDYFLDNAEPSVVICDENLALAIRPLVARYQIPHCLTLNADGAGSLSRESAAFPAHFTTVVSAGDEIAALLYSSGTTGRPKGIQLTHDNLATNAWALVVAWHYQTHDVLLHMLPVFHVHGLFIALGVALMTGAKVLFAPRFDRELALHWLSEATVMMGVPTYYTRLLAESSLTAAHCTHIRLFISGSAPLLVETWQQFAARTGHQVLERYGMTETGVITTNPVVGARRPGAVGQPLPGVMLRIVDDLDNHLPHHAVGHVLVKGPNVFPAYWRKPEQTRADFTADGYFRTGDDGTLDEDGYLTLVGRAKDLIISGGLNVYPSEVELIIDELPTVAESAVVGLPHPDFGEQVVAFVVLQPGAQWEEAAARNAIRAKLAAYKCPKRFWVLNDLPRNAMGKIQKALLRQHYAGT